MGEGARRAGEGYYVRSYLCQCSKDFKIFQNMCCQCFRHFHHPSANILRQLNVGWAFSPTKISAFTLAEVLITLGIIGVVAAMTLPSVILNYQKKVTVNRLKQAYSTISQALVMAQKDHGDISGWDIASGLTSLDQVDVSLNNFAHKYLIPYIKSVEECPAGSSSQEREKCDYIFYWRNGVQRNGSNAHSYSFIINNGIVITLSLDGWSDDAGQTVYGTTIFMRIDLNGKQKPNLYGRDIFHIILNPSTTNINMYGIGQTREDLLDGNRGCKEKIGNNQSGEWCGALIQYDGWQIKDDYPW